MENKILIIGICGKMGSGKNYISSNYIIPLLEKKGYKVLEMSLADQIKINVMTKDNFDYDDLYINKTTQTRTLLQYEGTENGRQKFGDDIWIKYLNNWISIFSKRGINAFVIPDIRYINEANWVKERGGILIKIIAPIRNELRLQKESNGDDIVYKKIKLHNSETEMDDIEDSFFNQIVFNDPIENNNKDYNKNFEDLVLNIPPSNSGIIVQKYGGTSIGTPEKMSNIIYNIKQNINLYKKIYIVTSAISNSVKKNGTTSKLLECINIFNNKNQNCLDKIEIILNDLNHYHQSFANFIKNEDLKNFIDSQFKFVYSTFLSAFISGIFNLETRDLILSHGELLSSKILLEFFNFYNNENLNIKFIDLSNTGIINDNYSNINLEKLIKTEPNDKIIIIGGFLGNFKNGIIETIGRGYSDFTAGLISKFENIEELQIWKEVDGIFSADPNIVTNAKLLNTISKEEISQLTYYGCQAINPLTIDIVNCPIRIKNCNKPNDIGTLIINDSKSYHNKKNPIAVTIKDNINVINISSNKKSVSIDFFVNIFTVLKKYKIINDLISTSQIDISIAIDCTQNYDEKLLIKDLSEFGTVDIIKNLSILSLIGKNMIKSVGIAGKMFKILAKNKINIEMISQGSSEINISCVINTTDSIKALCYIHYEMIE